MVGLRHGREHVLEVRRQFGWSLVILSYRLRARSTTERPVGVAELSEQFISGHAERLIRTPDDHTIEEAPWPPR
jgi:hypothetical protein